MRSKVTPLEELQAAHKRLSELREESGGGWHRRALRGVERRLIDDEYGACRADMSTGSDATLIVTLHRTIDPQLAILWSAIAEVEYSGMIIDDDDLIKTDEPNACHMALVLARAINGEAS